MWSYGPLGGVACCFCYFVAHDTRLQKSRLSLLVFFLQNKKALCVLLLLLFFWLLTMVLQLSPDVFNCIGREYIYHRKEMVPGRSEEFHREFKAHYGVSPKVCLSIWLIGEFPHGTKPKHLLWGLSFLKRYSTEMVLAKSFEVDRKTYRKWVWVVVKTIAAAYPLVVKWENRLKGNRGKTCKITVDGTDYEICEPKPFSTMWYSHKFKGPGLRYEIGVSIQGGDVVWTKGPFPCGSWPDITVFRFALKSKLEDGEMVEADRGYRGEPLHIRLPHEYVNRSDKKAKSWARARHETLNGRLKNWNSLLMRFRHPLHRHVHVFRAVVVMTQLSINHGESLFEVPY